MKFRAFCSSLLAAMHISEQVNALTLDTNAQVIMPNLSLNAFEDEANQLAQVYGHKKLDKDDEPVKLVRRSDVGEALCDPR